MSQPWVIGNWKMNGSRGDLASFQSTWSALADYDPNRVNVALAVPSPYLSAVDLSCCQVMGQDCAEQAFGPFTGDVSAGMLVDCGCSGVIIGHSERRQGHGETDALVLAKAERAQQEGLIAVVCIGETLAQRDSGDAESVVHEQLSRLGVLEAERLIIAYEPVWAIGTGQTATPAQAQTMHHAIRGWCRQQFGAQRAEALPLLYGGSVSADNASDLFACDDIDGALVGGASLDPVAFAAVVSAAAH
jgi:triosephosphate isomerase